ncbi:MAG: ABC transporter substrate-binding protein [Spirochaetales bacterium]|nr:ABC transporter substrate-binding protein [Spirochaetales bacterium]MBQ9811338.1 ABC transporter substrate-binding protein [Spirochaetales bacterium]
MKKVLFAVIVSLICLSCVFANAASEQSKQDLVKIRIAHHKGLAGAGVAVIGTRMGYFAEEGLDVELVPFTAGPPEVAAMVSGDLQFGYIGSGATNLAANGEVEIIYFNNLGDAEVIVVNKNSGIKSVAELKGKTLATTLGTSAENIVNFALQRAGLTMNDVNIINMDQSGCVTAMLSGKVDAVCVYSTFRATVETELGENCVKLAKTSDFSDITASIGSWLTTQEYIDNHGDIVQHFANALAKCMDYWKANQEQVAVWVAELLEAEESAIKAQIGTFSLMNASELKAALSDGSLKAMYAAQHNGMLVNGKLEKDVALEEYIHWDIMENAVKSAK